MENSLDKSAFRPGLMVREKGKKQIMMVKGTAGLSAHGTRADKGKTLMSHKVVCEWRTSKGAVRSAAFLVSALELAPATKP
ncbi:hypothetical protein [Paraburkholderia sp. RL17-347-BIC-D]|uniref:hypothetical protein n=1 Tax=Paraburkholderia sp. RL17-347-BIC-D TaxID=3031632 RepID=UPI0038BD3F5C